MHMAEILSPYLSATTPLLESLDEDDELPPSSGGVALVVVVVVVDVAAAKSPPVVVGVGVNIVLSISEKPPESPVVAALPSYVYVGS